MLRDIRPKLPIPTRPSNGEPTNNAAAESIRYIAPTIEARILSYVESQGFTGATGQEMGDVLSIELSTAYPCVWTLFKLGILMELATTRKTRSGRAANVLIAIDWEPTR